MKQFFIAASVMLAASFFITGCDDDDFSINRKEIMLHAGETYQLSANEAATWAIGNNFIASISSGGLVTGNHVGTTVAKAVSGSEVAYCGVVVTARYNTFSEPILNASYNINMVKKAERRRLISATNTTATFEGGKKNVNYLKYHFSPAGGRMDSIQVEIEHNGASEVYTEVSGFLEERYQEVELSEPVSGIRWFASGASSDDTQSSFTVKYVRNMPSKGNCSLITYVL
ncbi:Ig-like domain-containing protein [Xylanibacter muris]|uniref:BIG2 domain-containing protein n=1 Tax=Xylanibacter muris TaxID=2736290 RepID=A0ABX2ALI4_9BACT|nr:Ig-like domain-containing protein [Xylanibacter muris]NPD91899.1 hypothetical protein [Xylanibacter muris]